MKRWTVATLLVGMVLLGLLVGCAPSSNVCLHARMAHVTVQGCPQQSPTERREKMNVFDEMLEGWTEDQWTQHTSDPATECVGGRLAQYTGSWSSAEWD